VCIPFTSAFQRPLTTHAEAIDADADADDADADAEDGE
jgi:hypothetical protein